MSIRPTLVALLLSAWAQAGTPRGWKISVGGFEVGKSTLFEVAQKYPSAKMSNVGPDASSESRICLSSKNQHWFYSSSDIGGPEKTITGILLYNRGPVSGVICTDSQDAPRVAIDGERLASLSVPSLKRAFKGMKWTKASGLIRGILVENLIDPKDSSSFNRTTEVIISLDRKGSFDHVEMDQVETK